MPRAKAITRLRVLVLTSFDTDSDVLPAVEAGATGYLLKDAPREELLRAVRSAHRGESADGSLSKREREGLALVADGTTDREAARSCSSVRRPSNAPAPQLRQARRTRPGGGRRRGVQAGPAALPLPAGERAGGVERPAVGGQRDDAGNAEKAGGGPGGTGEREAVLAPGESVPGRRETGGSPVRGQEGERDSDKVGE